MTDTNLKLARFPASSPVPVAVLFYVADPVSSVHPPSHGYGAAGEFTANRETITQLPQQRIKQP
jgi:hypothetical protein